MAATPHMTIDSKSSARRKDPSNVQFTNHSEVRSVWGFVFARPYDASRSFHHRGQYDDLLCHVAALWCPVAPLVSVRADIELRTETR